MNYSTPPERIDFQSPSASDAREIWQMVESTSDLDSNSPYAYMLLCSHFSATGLVAYRESRLVGFVLGYMRPDVPATAFVWQVAVSESSRGLGLGRALLDRWFARCADALDARFLEATVTPSNSASRALFTAFAAKRNAPLTEEIAFPSTLFPELPDFEKKAHEDEIRFRIGPLSLPNEAALERPRKQLQQPPQQPQKRQEHA